ncbi:MAG: imidazole glycerol phosphate synthase subunit HisH, partial [Nanoarchaeota archaeon]|nr:imidazole glycerol phosphate synthase subunit HisH [Nanoarchaeota archaeon]
IQPLFSRTPNNASFYFDHSYHFVCEDKFVAATCNYGEEMVAAVQKDNILGVQFHPEKSHNNGLKLLRGYFNYMQKQVKK